MGIFDPVPDVSEPHCMCCGVRFVDVVQIKPATPTSEEQISGAFAHIKECYAKPENRACPSCRLCSQSVVYPSCAAGHELRMGWKRCHCKDWQPRTAGENRR